MSLVEADRSLVIYLIFCFFDFLFSSNGCLGEEKKYQRGLS